MSPPTFGIHVITNPIIFIPTLSYREINPPTIPITNYKYYLYGNDYNYVDIEIPAGLFTKRNITYFEIYPPP